MALSNRPDVILTYPMMCWLLKFILAPVLIVQAKQVRKNTPRLAEAAGPRRGIQGQGKKQIRLLREKFKVQKFLISAVPPMARFPALPWPLKWYLGLCSAHMNQALRKWLRTQPDCHFMEFNLPLERFHMAEDGFHPGPGLHALWAEEIFKKMTRGNPR